MKILPALAPLAGAILLFSAPLNAQQFDPEHRHSIEISTGVPPFQAWMFNSHYSPELIESGLRTTVVFCPSLNLSYTYALSEYWDLNILVNACTAIERNTRYLVKEYTYDTPNGPQTGYMADTDSDPLWSELEYPGAWYTPMVDFRWKWLRRDGFRLYSSIGLSCFVMANFQLVLPLPYFTPIGINFGSGHFYGVAELNFSNASTGLLAGVGYRF